ncbi:NADPH oxidase 4 isoform X1 [Manduca sexta]|uniref:NADPH oxidase 4 isoform X1 n=2 Tax=Manduca sexta TaxID=7130 RepID=UPI00188F89AD|nr:NADPH oxidase 4 isoform X1 [Manduca sexta]
MKIISLLRDCVDLLKRRFFLISWISLVVYLFYDTFMYYKYGRKFYHLRKILGLGLYTSRGTASVLNLCCALILLPLCKKLNQILYRILSKLWPGLFFFWLEKAKSFHMTVAVTLLFFAVLHSISHFVNLWNFSRGYDEEWTEINFANYRGENPVFLLLTMTGMTGVSMLLIVLCMGATSMRIVRRRVYNAFWYTHQLYLPFLVLLIIHPLSGVLKEEIIEEPSQYPSHIENWTTNSTVKDNPKFIAIKSKTWLWISLPLSCFLLDLLWRVFTRNRARVDILEVSHMSGRTISLRLSCPHKRFACRAGQYVLLQCLDASLIEWHPFTVVKVPTSNQRNFVVWIRVKGDWTETLEKLLLEKGINKLSMLVDGPFSSPMESVGRSDVAICVAAGVGITPFVTTLHHMLMFPRSRLPGRIHLVWIVRHEKELTWLADLANKILLQLRNANRPDRLHLELYVTNRDSTLNHIVTVNEKGRLSHLLDRVNEKNGLPHIDRVDEKATLLTPNLKRSYKDGRDDEYDVAKEYPLLGCRVRRGRPHWDRVFGYWVHLYPENRLNLYCCGPKKLVKSLRDKCKEISRDTKTKFTFVHEGFS